MEREVQLPGLAYGVPVLSTISLADIVKLRANEEVFAEVRGALVALQDQCTQDGVPNSWAQYQRQVRAFAEDVVSPVYDGLNRRLQRGRIMSGLVGAASGALARLTIHAAASLLGISAGNAGHQVGPIVKSRVAKKLKRPELEVACSILVELVTPDFL
jgi:hypothetical protein